MIAIPKESLAPTHFESLRQTHRANADGLVPEIVFPFFSVMEFARALASRRSQPRQLSGIQQIFIRG
jgi:hypothetical protein